MKDELVDKIMTEFTVLRQKTRSYLTGDKAETKQQNVQKRA